MRIRLAIPDRLVTPKALEAALEATTIANQEAIERGEIPDLTDAIKQGVKWKPEPFTDGEHFDLGHQVAARGWGDCDDLSPWLAGQMRASGEDEGARPRVYQTGPNRWHVVVQASDGQILDPSEWAGMKRNKSANVSGVSGMTSRPMARPGTGAICVIKHKGHWYARVDMPWSGTHTHLASHSRGATPDQALHRAVTGAIMLGDSSEAIDPLMMNRLQIAGETLLTDASEVGSLFGGLGKLIKGVVKTALPIASSFIPGGSLVTSALSSIIPGGGGGKKAAAAAPMPGAPGGAPLPPEAIQHPSGAVSMPLESRNAEPPNGQHMMLTYHPYGYSGPVVMRF